MVINFEVCTMLAVTASRIASVAAVAAPLTARGLATKARDAQRKAREASARATTLYSIGDAHKFMKAFSPGTIDETVSMVLCCKLDKGCA